MNKWIALTVLALTLTSCTGYIWIERSESFITQKETNPKIVCIDPQVRVFGSEDEPDLEASEKLEEYLREQIAYAVIKQGLNVEVLTLSAAANASYYQQLLSLKKEFLQANNYQDTPLNFREKPDLNSVKKSIFVYPPLVAHEFVELSKEYDTPYFSYIGVFQKNDELLFYHLIINTDKAETVYRELKRISRYKMRKGLMAQMVYDSMAMLKEELQ